jgi:hypothetical protein
MRKGKELMLVVAGHEEQEEGKVLGPLWLRLYRLPQIDDSWQSMRCVAQPTLLDTVQVPLA